METPCIDVCVIDPKSGLRNGCGRTIDEISRWVSMTPAERRAVMAQLSGRMAAANKER